MDCDRFPSLGKGPGPGDREVILGSFLSEKKRKKRRPLRSNKFFVVSAMRAEKSEDQGSNRGARKGPRAASQRTNARRRVVARTA